MIFFFIMLLALALVSYIVELLNILKDDLMKKLTKRLGKGNPPTDDTGK